MGTGAEVPEMWDAGWGGVGSVGGVSHAREDVHRGTWWEGPQRPLRPSPAPTPDLAALQLILIHNSSASYLGPKVSDGICRLFSRNIMGRASLPMMNGSGHMHNLSLSKHRAHKRNKKASLG